MKVQNFGDAEKYLKANGLKNEEFRVSLDINNIELFIGQTHEYFISVGEWDNNTFEVFAHSVGAEWGENGFCIKDGKLVQYKVYKSLKKAIDFALKCLKDGNLPESYIKMW